MDLGRLGRLVFARVLHPLLRIAPRRGHVFIASWPADEGNAVETVRALARRYRGRIVWADAPSGERLRQLGIEPARVVAMSKNSLAAIWSFLTAEATFYTHGVYGCPKPVPGKSIVNLWHGDGVKVTAGVRIYSTYLVTSSSILSRARVHHFQVPPGNVLVTGLPRVEQLRQPSSAEQLTALGIEPGRPFAVWMPTYRQAEGAGLSGSFVDTADVSVDAEIAKAIAPGLASLREQGIQIVVKPHPLDAVSRDDPGFILITDEAIRRAGTTLYHVLGASAGVLTDYSSVWTDYLALDRPIGFFMPDLQAYLSGRGLEPADSMEHLPGPFLRTVADFEHLGAEIRGAMREPGQTLRGSAREHFKLVHPPRPAEQLVSVLLERGALGSATQQEG